MTAFTISLRDAKSQECSLTMPLTPMTAVNHDVLEVEWAQVLAATLAVTTAAHYSKQVTHSIEKHAFYARPTSGYANRESQVVLTIAGATSGKLYTISLPAPDLDLWPFNTDGQEIYDAPFTGLAAAIVTFIDMIEAVWEQNGEQGVVTRFRFVGRNL